MATFTLVIVFGLVLLYGCVSATINVSSGTGRHELGPDKDQSFETSKDSQSSTDAINRVESKISGIDKSQNKISEQIDKTSEVQQQQVRRDEAIDRKSPFISKEERQKIYRDK